MGHYNCYRDREKNDYGCYFCNMFKCTQTNSNCCCQQQMPCEEKKESGCSICEAQMKNVLSQLITLYSGKTFTFYMEDGSTATGTLVSIFDNCNSGLIRILTTSGTSSYSQFINICKIAYFTISAATYNTAINYLDEPNSCCESPCGCNGSIENLLVVGSSVAISAGGTTIAQSTVTAEEPGITVLMTGTNLNFVSNCQIEIIRVY